MVAEVVGSQESEKTTPAPRSKPTRERKPGRLSAGKVHGQQEMG